jgi:peptidoglycan/LPS O-acetylase OafA/YrhL
MNYLTSLRGIAALLVVLFHIKLYLADIAPARPLVPLLSHGYLAVDFFLVLSGFIMAYKYHDTFRTQVGTHFFDFLAKRIARIFPLHAFVMLAYIAIPVTLYATGREYDQSQFGLYQFVNKFLLVDLWTFDQISWKSWNVPSWTISAELLAYVLFPLLMFQFQRFRGWLLPILLAGACLALAFAYRMRECSNLGECIGQLGLFRCLMEFALGIGVYLRYRSTTRISARAFAAITCAALTAYAAFALSPVANYWYVPALFAVLLYGTLGFTSVAHRVLEIRPLVFLGDISYSVYLTHVLIAEVVFRVFVPARSVAAGPWVVMGYLAVTLLFSTLTYLLVEKPARHRLYVALTGWRGNPRSAHAKD